MVHITWRLRMVAAERGVWSGAELGRLMQSKGGKGLSPPSISVLMTKQPKELKLDTLAALCAALECTPNDLIVLTEDGNKSTKTSNSDSELVGYSSSNGD